MRVLPLTLAASLIATQSAALSCMQPDVARSFHWAAESEDTYIVLLGAFEFTMPRQTSTDTNAPDVLQTQSRFTGQYLGATGFVDAPPLTIDLEFSCLAAWCGSLPDTGAQTLAFVKLQDGGYALSIGPCFDEAFVNPSAADITQVEACMRGEGCVEHR